jgi:hypothetical protein
MGTPADPPGPPDDVLVCYYVWGCVCYCVCVLLPAVAAVCVWFAVLNAPASSLFELL